MGAYIRSPSKKGAQGESSADKGKAEVVVNVENNDSWEWFLACLCEDLRLCSGAYMTVISDGHKGLMKKRDITKKSCKRDKQPKLAKEKRKLGRKIGIDQTRVDESGIDQDGGADLTGAGPIDADPTVAVLSDADPTCAGPNYIDPIEDFQVDDNPTSQSKASDTVKMIEDVIATGKLKFVGLKRRCKSGRIAKGEKSYQFRLNGEGSYFEKAWDVHDVLAE
ncbi:hypothetical protein Tco_0816197 [Tanacetum coccineum]